MRVLLAAPLLLAAALFALVTGERLLSGFSAVTVLGSLWSRPRLRAGPPAQALAVIGCTCVAFVVQLLSAGVRGLGDRPLLPVAFVVAGGALLVSALRTHVKEPQWGHPATLAIGLLVFLGCGMTRSGALYPALLVGYFGLSILAAFALDPALYWGRLRSGRSWITAGGVPLLALGVAFALALGLPRVYREVYAWAVRRWVGANARASFGEGPIALGSLEGLLQSDVVTLRIFGSTSTHLRANVYTRYYRGGWSAPPRRSHEFELPPPLTPTPIRIEFTSASPERFFLPLDTATLRTEPERIRVDDFGLVEPLPEEAPHVAWLSQGRDRLLPVGPPSREDIHVPEALRAPIGSLATRWVGSERDARRMLAILVRRLETEFTYSLEYQRRADRDPVLQFLFDDRRGHCEYFASALALLARSLGIPARVVTGYHVAEWNPYGGYAIVRERDAHAWVEAFVPGRGWMSADASPETTLAELRPSLTPWAAGLLDLMRVQIAWHGRVLALAALLLVLVSIQLRRLFAQRSLPREDERDALRGRPGWIQLLLDRLEGDGYSRSTGETLERFAARLEAVRAPWGRAAALLERYAALRYGRKGDPARLRADVMDWAATESGRPRRRREWVANGGASASDDLAERPGRRPAPERLDRLAGVLLGTAIGDSLGLPYEGLSRCRVRRMLGSKPLRHAFWLGRGLCSDDTEHACMVGQALLASAGEPERFARSLAWRLRFWLLGLPAGIGFGTLRGILKLWLGFPPERSGVGSAGNGPAMRAALIGVYAAGDRDQLRALNRASTRLTHTDFRAEQGALAIASAAALATQWEENPAPAGSGFDVARDRLQAISDLIDCETLRALLSQVAEALEQPAEHWADRAGLSRGISGYVYHSVPAALLCWLRNPDDFRAALEEVIRLGGDTDTTAAMVGALVGATAGASRIPRDWLRGMADWPRSVAFMGRLARELATCGTPVPLCWPALLPRNLLFLLGVLRLALCRLLPPYG